ncbi:fumarylacetoacetate hydrolase family protein [Tropicimonas sediminicola]|uniref:2-keto-4-pentenoate hydratase/2-oxohepta-3-ene-1,7-dioic acid hydratase (Catechol pathway) n=1 Tax=Tropicimonas sediminicola TaxID=1031541 RepID=A0A239M761_9RHOB|nr:fumarylacetoacetate hydrolase family protein [Tropicimonas sediminicola]SNT37689.1 2-keto-4-pentenoate hydratase/2-oxohepta-3-ene-1,7-dioic acid hydratase (catechol pathway) [Tropicimonas sediminicola]
MKLCRIRTADGIVPAAVDAEGRLRSLEGHIGDFTCDSIAYGGLAPLEALELADLPLLDETDYAPILADIRRIFGIGLNYSDHAKESGLPIPEQPILFMKMCPASGANDAVVIPKGSEKTDWEVELGVVIGRRAQHVSVEKALDCVAGYCVVNDVSERAFQIEMGGQWVKGKSCDSFAPVGPWLVTPEEVPDPQALDLFLDLNGERVQTGSTSKMIFSVAEIISHLSRFLTLEPGDLISTGTPPGVGMGMKPPRYLQPGDEMRLGVQGLGEQRQLARAWEA